MKQGRSGFNLFVAIFFVMLGLCANTPSVFAEDNEVNFSMVAQGQNDDLWWFFVHLKNLSDKEVSINISPTIVDSNGNKYTQTKAREIDLLDDYVAKGRWYLNFTIPKGFGFTFGDNNHVKKIGLQATNAVIIPLSFKLPAGNKPVRIDLNQEGLTADLSKIPVLPLLPAPKVKIGNQPPGIEIGIKEVARAVGEMKNQSVPGALNYLNYTEGLIPALKVIHREPGSILETHAPFTISPDDVWLVVSVSFMNIGQSAIDVPLDRIVIVSKLPEKEEDGYSPVGMAAGKRVFRGGPPLTDPLLLKPVQQKR